MNGEQRLGEPQLPLLLSIKQAARTLNLSERTVWTLVHTQQLPHLRIGRRLLFSRSALEAWITRQQTGGDPNARAIG
ncbi:MAG TPA: helix-turn-helix domain-containing protein [Pirellulales bacterium]|jgi:excisionase family DNA binding protein|nr:helix-turn-helix domain-containing protein [Pirellulales bacterium]